jgi:Ni/Fe-hydrogenase subunit HybB-like protein
MRILTSVVVLGVIAGLIAIERSAPGQMGNLLWPVLIVVTILVGLAVISFQSKRRMSKRATVSDTADPRAPH